MDASQHGTAEIAPTADLPASDRGEARQQRLVAAGGMLPAFAFDYVAPLLLSA